MAATKSYTFLDPAPLARQVVIWLYVHLAVGLFFGLANAVTLTELSRLDPTSPVVGGLSSDLLLLASAVLYLLAFVVSGFLILKWTYRVNRNAHAFASGLSTSPPWSVGWYFIPFASLWKPYQALSETWRASAAPERWRSGETPSLFPWWWGLWIASNVLGNLSWRLPQTTIGERQLSTSVDLVALLIEAPLSLVLIQIVRRLTAAQTIQAAFGGERAAAPRPLVLGAA